MKPAPPMMPGAMAEMPAGGKPMAKPPFKRQAKKAGRKGGRKGGRY